ncbi:hypothetical protein [Streptomyces cynarae]
MSGRVLYAVVGGLAGALVLLVLDFYRSTARLSEVKVTVPQLSEFTFVVNDDARQVAWHLFVETVTRVSTQPLADGDGLIREALTSLYGLFATTRDTLKASRPSIAVSGGHTVEQLAIAMLNRELRPFLSAWHPRLRVYEEEHPGQPESLWPQCGTCRTELRAVQRHLAGYAHSFARLAGVRDAADIIRATAGFDVSGGAARGPGGGAGRP